MLQIKCSEVWGGIKNEDVDAQTASMDASLYSSAAKGGKGGDVYYMSVCSADKVTRMAIADVVGHGDHVSSISGWLYDSLQARMNGLEGEAVLADLNRLVVERGFDALTTAAVVTIYREGEQASFTYAGHPATLLQRHPGQDWEEVAAHEGDARVAHFPLGVQHDVSYLERTVPIRSGDRLLLYTDGILETPSPSGELFGQERLLDLLRQSNGASLPETKAAVLDTLRDFAGGDLRHDDVTLLMAEVR